MKTTQHAKPVTVKPAKNVTSTTSTSTLRPLEKISSRIPSMNEAKVLLWLAKTAKTIVNHYDSTAKQRKCTESYWAGLHKRYALLSQRAVDLTVWESYCQSNSKAPDHSSKDLIA